MSESTIVGWMQEQESDGRVRTRAVFWDRGEADLVHSLADRGSHAEANAVSGTLVVGQVTEPARSGSVAAFWNTDESGIPAHVLPDLGPPLHPAAVAPQATGASGTRVVGLVAIPGTDELTAAFWDTAEPETPVHVLPGLSGGSATASGVSGTLVVGASGGQAVFWDTAETGTPVHVLPDLGDAHISAQALAVSGSRIVGLVGVPSTQFNNQSRAAFWDTSEPGIPLHLLPGLGDVVSGDMATGVSGTRVVGMVVGSSQRRAVFWDTAEPGSPAHALSTLGGSFQPPTAVSGTLIVGQAQDSIGNDLQAVFWDTVEPGIPVHVLPGSVERIGGVQALSVSGALVVGQARDVSRTRAVLWDMAEPGSPPHALPDFGGFVSNQATGVSGTLIVGQAEDPVTSRSLAVLWDAGVPGLPVSVLPDLGGRLNQATGVSGTLIVGQAEDSTAKHRPVLWDVAGPGIAVRVLPDLGGLFAGGIAKAVDGTLIVGRVFNPATNGSPAAFWDAAEPGSPVHVLPDLGLSAQASGVSETLIVGEAHDSTGRRRAVFWDRAEPGSPVHVLPDFARDAQANGVSGTLIVGEADDSTGRRRAVFWDLAALGSTPTALPDPGGAFAVGRAVAVTGTRIVGQPGALVWDLVPNFIVSFAARSTVGSVPIVGIPVAFEATVEEPSRVNSVEWDFDGNGSVDQTTTTLTTEHTYATAGSFPARVRIVTDDGDEASAVTTVRVRSASLAIDSFTATSTLGSAPIAGVPVAFKVTVDEPSRVSSVEWDFDGNGTMDRTTTTLTTEYTYATAGVYPARVTVVAQEGGRTSAITPVALLSASQAIDSAKSLLQQLPLRGEQANSLATKLDGAQKLLTRGNLPGTCNKLSDVVAHVQRLIRTGQLDPAIAEPVLEELRAAEISLGCP